MDQAALASVSESFTFYTPSPLESPAGQIATDIQSLRDGIAACSDASLFQHVTRMPVRHPHARDVPENDFARWAGDAMQMPEVSERLAFVGSGSCTSFDELRGSLLGVLDRVQPKEKRREAPEGAAFHFLEAHSVLAPLGTEARTPAEVIEVWPWIDLGSAFYHLVEAPLRGTHEHALIPWLRAHGGSSMADSAEQVVRSSRPLNILLKEVGARWRRSMIGRRLIERAEAPELERQREARAAMARLAGRLRGRGNKQ
ncbi:MAG TPA: DUF5752 family protein [Candidatus Eisenbacteria bacterium]|nr:DUF5752 family protein [Candidatus Eisenbacteria bacterium]